MRRLPLLLALQSPAFRLLWLAQSLSSLGDFVSWVGLLVLVYKTTGSGTAIAGLFLIQTIPTLVLAPLAGVAADRYDRRRLMILSDVLRGAVVLGLVFRPTLPMAYVVSALVSSLSVFFGPARRALVPRTVAPEHLMAANSLDALTSSLTRIFGAGLGAGLVGAAGPAVAFALNALSFFVSAVFVGLARIPGRPASAQAHAPRPVAAGEAPRRPGLRAELGESLRFLRSNRGVAALILLLFFNTLGLGAANVLTAPLVETCLGADTSSLGWLMSAEGAGTAVGVAVLGSLIGAALAGWAALGASLVLGMVLIGLGFCAQLWQAAGLFLVGGLALVAFNVSAETYTQLATTDEIRGRVFSVVMAVLAAGSILSAVAGGVAADLVGVRTTFRVMGLAIVAGAAVYAVQLSAAGRAEAGPRRDRVSPGPGIREEA